MKALDTWVIERHERFARWFQRWTGKTNFWLAKTMYILFILSPVAHIGSLTLGDAMSSSAAPSFLVITGIGLVMKGYVFRTCDHLEEYYANGDGTAHPGTLRVREYWQGRLLMVCVLSLLGVMQVALLLITVRLVQVPPLLTVPSMIFMGFWWTAVIHAYFLACVPLPPCKSKIREWLESFQPEPEKATVPVR